MIKVYLRNFSHPIGGLFTQFLDQIQPGDQIKLTAVGGDIGYLGHGQFLFRNQETGLMETKTFKNIGMIAGGTGIAPMYQLIQTVNDLKTDATSLSLLY
mmetsp:Transcript_34449/g.33649  ORF Transcript_34449/g.33649 Transcript_34449/m.33649 type:complete len:99 (+) Transcript_34449:395-691(+)